MAVILLVIKKMSKDLNCGYPASKNLTLLGPGCSGLVGEEGGGDRHPICIFLNQISGYPSFAQRGPRT